eukprot:scaffold766_cov210-Alexandrium_tamarense.AAC.25
MNDDLASKLGVMIKSNDAITPRKKKAWDDEDFELFGKMMKKKRVNASKDSIASKRNSSSHSHYKRCNHKLVTEANPSADNHQIMRLVASKFKELDEVVTTIVEFSMPRNAVHAWEWMGVLGQVSKAVLNNLHKNVAKIAPTQVTLDDFKRYNRLGARDGEEPNDVREGFLKSLNECDWKRKNLKEFHFNYAASEERNNDDSVSSDISDEEGDEKDSKSILKQLHTLITTPGSLPSLEWLDIIGGEVIKDYETFRLIPAAAPALQQLCLGCFGTIRPQDTITPQGLKQLFQGLPNIKSVSFGHTNWLRDDHVLAIMPVIGGKLNRFELISCIGFDDEEDWDDGHNLEYLQNASLFAIAKHCKKLESFAIVESSVDLVGLVEVFKANPNITTLNLSDNGNLNGREDVIGVISSNLPSLRELRGYQVEATNERHWLNDDSLIALISAQAVNSGSSNIPLKLIGFVGNEAVTERALTQAIQMGVTVLETTNSVLIQQLKPQMILHGANAMRSPSLMQHSVDGSKDNEAAVMIM